MARWPRSWLVGGGAALAAVAVVAVVTAGGQVSAAQGAEVGEVVTVAGDGVAHDVEGIGVEAGLDQPAAVAELGGGVYVHTRAAVMRYTIGSGQVERVAGDGAPGCTDSAPGVQARLSTADDVAVRGFTLLVASRGCSAVREVALATGTVTRLAQVSNVRGVTTDPGGAIYVAHGSTVSRLVADLEAGPNDPPFKTEPFVHFLHGEDFSYPLPMAMSGDDDALWVAVGSLSSLTAVRLARVDWDTGEISVLAADTALRAESVASSGATLFAATQTAVRRYDKADGSWTLVAGTSSWGFADGAGPDAWFGAVSGLAGSEQALWITDRSNNRLRRSTPTVSPPAVEPVEAPLIGTGSVSTLSGPAALGAPTAVAVVEGEVHVAGRGLVARVDTDGSVTPLAGQDGVYGAVDSTDPESARFSSDIRQLASDGQFLYAADRGNGRLRRVSLATGATSTVALLHQPYGVAFADGTLFVSRSGAVYEVDPLTGEQELVASMPAPYSLGGAVAVDGEAVWVVVARSGMFKTQLVRVDRSSGEAEVVAEDAALGSYALANAGDHLYAATAHALRRYDKTEGSWVAVAGTSAGGFHDGSGTEAWFSGVRGIAASTDAWYVADSGNDHVRVVTAGVEPETVEPVEAPPIALGAVGTVAEGTGVSTGDLHRPAAVVVVGDAVYVAVHGAVQRVQPDGTVHTVAGQPGVHGSTDSAVPALVRFSSPIAQMATDGVFLYVADRGNNKVRRVSLETGATSTVASLSGIRGIAYRDGTLYVSQGAGIRRVDPGTGAYEWFATFQHGGDFAYPQAAALSAGDDALWVAVASLLSSAHVRLASVDWATGEATLLTQHADLFSTGILSAGDGVYAVTQRGVRWFDKSDGAITTMPAGSPTESGLVDGLGGSVRFAWNHGLATDGAALYVTDFANDALRLVYDYEFVRDPGDLAGRAWYAAFVADPVNAATGAFVESEIDLPFPPAAEALTVRRTYNSRGAGDAPDVTAAGWTWDHDERVEPAAGGAVWWRRGDGRVVTFEPDGAGGFARPLELRGDLEVLASGWELAFDDGARSEFDAGGRLLSRTRPDGVEVTYAYDGGLLVSASASSGHGLAFAHDGAGRLAGVTASDGREVAYSYDDAGHLASVTLPDGSERAYFTDGRGRVVEVTDGTGRLVVANRYDAFGRVIEQETPTGNTILFDYDTGERVTRVIDIGAGSTTLFAHDDAARLVGITDAAGGQVERGYSLHGFATSAVDRAGGVATQVVDARGNVLERTRPDGAVESWAYDGLDRVTAHTDATGGVTAFDYGGGERVPSQVTHPDGGVTTQVVVDGLVTQRTDPDGVTESYGYDAQRNLVTVTDGAGAATALAYDTAGRLLSRTSPLGHETSFAWDAAGRLLSETDPAGATTTYTYDAAGKLLSVTDPTGATTAHTYDPAGLLVETVDPLGAVTTFEHDAMEQLVAVTEPGGAVTASTWGPLGRLESVTDPEGVTVAYGYDAQGNVTSVTDGAGEVTVSGHDAAGRVTSVTDPLGRTRSFAYDAAGRLVAETDPAGGTSTHAYDVTGRRVETEDATGAVTAFAWTPGGRLASVTDPSGGVTTYAYDAAGRLAAETDPLGGVTAYAYDLDSRLVSVTSPEGLVTGYGYDAAGRVVAETHPDGGVTATAYTARGEVASVTDATGGVRSFAYDEAGRLVSVTDANGAVTLFGYDARGNRVSRTDADGQVEVWAFDAADRLVSHTDRLGRVSTWGYDAAGRVASVVDASGRSRAFGYDAAGQAVSETFGDGSTGSRSFDAAGRVTSVADASGTVAYGWDAAGRLSGFTATDGASWGYGWVAGRLVSLTGPDGRQVSYGYDSAGRLVSVATPGVGGVAYGYDADGRLVSEVLPGGGSRSWQWAGGRLVSFAQQVDGVTSTALLVYDAAGRLVEADVDGTVTSYAYDAAGQLTGAVTAGGQARGYTYDGQGRRVSLAVDGAVTSYVYDVAGQLVEVAAPAGVTTLAYDAAGRRVGESGPGGAVAYEWDARGRLVSVSVEDGSSTTVVERGWDAEGRLASLSVSVDGGPGEVTSLWWDPRPPVARLARVQQGEAGPVDLVAGHGGGPVFAVDGGGLAGVFATDHLGSLTVTTATADLVAGGGYLPFGQPEGGPLDAGRVGLGYRGEVHTGGLVHLRAREYDAAAGVFLSPDPLDGQPGYATVTNGYHYAHNDPYGYVDPLGLRPWSDEDMDAGGWLTDGDGHNIARCGLASFSEAIGHYFTGGLLYRDRSCSSSLYDASWGSGHYTSEALTAATTAHALVVTRATAVVGSVGRSSTSAAHSVLPTPRVSDAKLSNIVQQFYKGTTNPLRIGSGTTADAVRHEVATGQRIFGRSHIQKARDLLRGLENWLKANPDAPYHDRLVARSLGDDLLDALGGVR